MHSARTIYSVMTPKTQCVLLGVEIQKFSKFSIFQVSGQLEGIAGQLEEQHKDTLQVLEMVTELRYIDGIEKIEALFTAVLTGFSFYWT
jgi:hypothetical protein